jgi:hypothetical protein
VKILIAFHMLLVSVTAFASQEEYYDWSTITYATYLEELKRTATLKVELSKVSEESGYYASKIECSVGGNRLEIPPEIFEKYNQINPGDFLISANIYPGGNDVTIHFTYSGKKRGSISFRNYKYSLHLITEGP